jgi:tetratricopeptide (TPR) repeat protein
MQLKKEFKNHYIFSTLSAGYVHKAGCLIFCGMAAVLCTFNMAYAQSVVIQSDLFAETDPVLDREDLQIEEERSSKEKGVVINKALTAEAKTGVVLSGASARVLSAEEILRVNESLRRAIEQSRKLREEKRQLDQEMMELKKEKDQAQDRARAMERKVTEFQQRLDQSEKLKEEYDRAMADLQNKFEGRVQNLLLQIESMRKEVERRDEVIAAQKAIAEEADVRVPDVPADIEQEIPPLALRDENGGDDEGATAEEAADGPTRLREVLSILDAQRQGLDVMDLLDYLDEARRLMKGDEAEIFYNMGRLLFYQGKYAEAAVHYRKALDLAPSVANAHFNLAYISGEFLKDYETALEHYHRYLHLKPGAEDAPLVREKILEFKLQLSTSLSAEREKELQQDKKMRMPNW